MSATLAAWLEAVAGSDDEFVERAWRLVLRREVEPAARALALDKLAAGTLSRATLLRDLVRSEEFDRVALLDDVIAFAAGARGAGERPRRLTAPAGSDERPIEIPWCLARYAAERRVLDVGYAFAEPAYLAGLLGLSAPELDGVDLARLDVPGLRSAVADVRNLPFADASFDFVLCISTLEHIGLDNSVYGVSAAQEASGHERALAELRRVLAPSGRLLVTVPCGAHEDLGWQLQQSPAEWAELFERAGFLVYEDEVYELGDDGWRSATTLGPVRYGERGPGASAVLCAELRPRRLGARARLVVRDLRHGDEPRRWTEG